VSFFPVVGTDEEAAVAGYLSAGSRAAARATTKAGCEERVSCRAGYQPDDTSSLPLALRTSLPSVDDQGPYHFRPPAPSYPVLCLRG
jgi:hypothetical protein